MNCQACGAGEQAEVFCTVCGARLFHPGADSEPPTTPPLSTAPVPGTYPAPSPPPPPSSPQPPASKSRKGCLWGCLAAILIPVLLAIGVLGWLGFVPGLSRVIGPKPRDLGVEMTVPAAYECADALSVPDTHSDILRLLEDPSEFESFHASLTSEQASSLLLLGQDGIPNWPLEFVQLRVNEDGTAETSGVLDFEQLTPFLTSNLGVPEGDVAEAVSRVMLTSDAPFYVKGTAGVQNNAVSMSLSEIQIGRLTVPTGWYQSNEHVGADYISSTLDREGFAIDDMTLGAGVVSTTGTRPLSSLRPWLDIAKDDRVEGVTP